MKGAVGERLGDERGVVIVEATIVFPVMFLVIFFMIFWGNAFYTKSKAESVARRVAVAGAAYCADLTLPAVVSGGAAKFSVRDVRPYRYVTGIDLPGSVIGDALAKEVAAIGSGMFFGMAPRSPDYSVKFENMLICASVTVDLTYTVSLPIRLFGTEDFLAIRVSARAKAPVPDAPEMIRNINMAEDYIRQTGTDAKLKAAVGKAKSLLS
ncbi:MAG: pilus assembly protein [Oscillospiraceae bacterium]|nr:pilus assembly protein [Oscillospiraceae bacterium]